MELQQFTEKFLLNSETRVKEVGTVKESRFIPEFRSIYDFCIAHFPEALQNYTDRICEKQRENCNKTLQILGRTSPRSAAILYTIKSDVLHAEQPKIDEL